MDREATTMSVREMRELLGIKKTDSYWLLKKNCFEVVKIAGKMRIVKKSFENWYAAGASGDIGERASLRGERDGRMLGNVNAEVRAFLSVPFKPVGHGITSHRS